MKVSTAAGAIKAHTEKSSMNTHDFGKRDSLHNLVTPKSWFLPDSDSHFGARVGHILLNIFCKNLYTICL